MYFMIDCRIEIEAADVKEAEWIADGIESAFRNLADGGLDGNAVLYVDNVRPTTGENDA